MGNVFITNYVCPPLLAFLVMANMGGDSNELLEETDRHLAHMQSANITSQRNKSHFPIMSKYHVSKSLFQLDCMQCKTPSPRKHNFIYRMD